MNRRHHHSGVRGLLRHGVDRAQPHPPCALKGLRFRVPDRVPTACSGPLSRRGTPPGARVDRRSVSWLAGHRLSPPSRVVPSGRQGQARRSQLRGQLRIGNRSSAPHSRWALSLERDRRTGVLKGGRRALSTQQWKGRVRRRPDGKCSHNQVGSRVRAAPHLAPQDVVPSCDWNRPAGREDLDE
jgi:hypothetical protein